MADKVKNSYVKLGEYIDILQDQQFYNKDDGFMTDLFVRKVTEDLLRILPFGGRILKSNWFQRSLKYVWIPAHIDKKREIYEKETRPRIYLVK